MIKIRFGLSKARLIQTTWIISIFVFLAIVVTDLVAQWLGISRHIQLLVNTRFHRDLLFALSYTIRQAVIWLVCAIGIMALFHKNLTQALQEWGFNGNIKTGWLVGFVATLPMLIILGAVGHANLDANVLLDVVVFGLITGIGEEALFRGFAFGMLYRQVHLGFWLSVIIPTVFFAIGHLSEVHTLSSSIGIFLITGFGSIWFAWLYVRWEYNLWVPIAVHTFMDSWWFVFNPSNTALGNRDANIARVITILLSIVLTLWHCHWDFRKAFIDIRPHESPLMVDA